MDNSKQSKQILLSVIGVAILVVAVVGVSFAFFNYTRTGAQNTVTTGKIKFTSSQVGGVTLTNKFPITTSTYNTQKNQTYDSSTMDFARVVVTVNGATTYSQGLDFRLTARDVNFTASVNNSDVTLPVNVNVVATQSSTGQMSGDRITAYPSLSGGIVPEAYVLADGHIAADDTEAQGYSWNETRFTATVTIDAYLDASKIAITDTSTNPSDPHIDEGTVNGTTSGQTGETTNWVNGRTVITTDQWNSLSASAANNLSFKVSVESKETGGTYVDHNS